MDLARGSPRLDAAAARDIARAGRLWEESCRRAGADAAEPSRPVIEALCAELVTAGAATRYRIAQYLPDHFAAMASIDITEIPEIEKMARSATHVARRTARQLRRREQAAHRRRMIVPVIEEAMAAVFDAPLEGRPEGVGGIRDPAQPVPRDLVAPPRHKAWQRQ